MAVVFRNVTELLSLGRTFVTNVLADAFYTAQEQALISEVDQALQLAEQRVDPDTQLVSVGLRQGTAQNIYDKSFALLNLETTKRLEGRPDDRMVALYNVVDVSQDVSYLIANGLTGLAAEY